MTVPEKIVCVCLGQGQNKCDEVAVEIEVRGIMRWAIFDTAASYIWIDAPWFC